MSENKKIVPANNFFDSKNTELDLIIIADNLKTPENMGAVIRLAGNFGAQKVIFINKEEINIRKINRFSASVNNLVETHFVLKAEQIEKYIDKSYKIIALDTVNNAKNINKFKFPKKIVLVVGNEKYGVSNELLNIVSESIYIPMNGKVKSMNVTHALAVALYEYSKIYFNLII